MKIILQKSKFACILILSISLTLLSGCLSNKDKVYNVWMELGNYEKALETADKMVKKYPADIGALNRKAIALISLGRDTEALPILDEIIATNPKNDDALNNKSWALYNLERYDEAHDYILQSLAIAPNSDTEYVNYGNILLATEKYPEARDAYKQALHIEPYDTDAIYGLGCTYYWLDDYNEAITQFSAYCKVFPNDTDAITFLGYSYLYAGNTSEARLYVERLKKMQGKTTDEASSDVRFNLLKLEAECQRALGKYDDAIETLNAAQKIKADSSLHVLMGEIHYELGNYTQSIRAYDALGELEPDSAYPCIQNVYNYLALDDIQAATEAAEKAMAREPENPEALNAMGNIFGWETQYRRAYAFFQDAVRVDPDYVTGHVNAMWALYNNSLYRKCITYGEEIVLRFPLEADIYGYLGDCWSMLQEMDKALENYKKAYEYAQYPIYYGSQIAWVHYMEQEFELAKAVLEDALLLEPDNEQCLQLMREIDKRFEPLSIQIADFVAKNYLYAKQVKDLDQLTQGFSKHIDADASTVSEFIESIRIEDDIFTFCLAGDDYDFYWDMEEGTTVTYQQVLEKTDDIVHYFDIDFFGYNTANEFIEIVEELPNKEGSVLVIDLRDNGGGLMFSCTEMLDYMLESCVVGNMIFKDGEISSWYSDDDAVSFKEIFILVNGNTASSSEMLTLGLKKYLPDVTIIGEPTFGKGVGQTVFDSKKDKVAVLLVNFYWNVKEENIMNSSIKPDIKVSGNLDRYLDKVESALGN